MATLAIIPSSGTCVRRRSCRFSKEPIRSSVWSSAANSPADQEGYPCRGIAALVTGAASGLGAATANHLARCGAVVYGLDLQQAIDHAAQPAKNIALLPADVTVTEPVQHALDHINTRGVPLRLAVCSHARGRLRSPDRDSRSTHAPQDRNDNSY
ncbi:SDR family NAD(P)-dependent oxidoreductase [Streptomyces sp. NPDC050164]|uniref:SDR family NAD(P)-dependent oxidoreductase n=1 Tax=Streptomyces sp. NPDC050164 TaxID=3365605 RepID=UPI00379A0B15